VILDAVETMVRSRALNKFAITGGAHGFEAPLICGKCL